MSEKSNAHKHKNKLTQMTDMISGALESTNTPSGANYQYSAAFTVPKAKQIVGIWKVIEHTVDGVPYTEAYAAATFKGLQLNNINYSATYEFSQNLCIKKVSIYGELDISSTISIYEYRMNVVLTWELKPGNIQVLPVLGYQYSCLDGKPAAVKDLPPTTTPLNLTVRFENEFMILEDGTDIKKLGRLEL